ncbi:acyltransferase domain-containing protein, partial [Streptomyces sparsogenes]|uniref:acyltransferase domain-containing protein n=1 Tax=Streptomyces sparsogenes TaxID=67365 RepID=UPI0033D42CD1
DELAEDLAAYGDRVGIAAVNTPSSTVISGPAEDVAALGAAWADKGRKTKALTVSHAFHSPLMEPVLERFEQALSGVVFHPPTLPLISTLTGAPAGEDIATPAYWARQIRQPVRFAPAVTHLAPDTGVFLELGPDPVLATATQHTLQHLRVADTRDDGAEPLAVAALTRKRPEVTGLVQALARLHTSGTDVDWTAFGGRGGRRPRAVALPTYAFQHQRFWLAPPARPGSDGAAEGADEAVLWQAIEEGDVEALTATLRLNEDGSEIDVLRPALPILSAWRRRRREQARQDSWRYEVSWSPLAPAEAPALSGTWLVFIPAGREEEPAVRAAVQALREHGAAARVEAVEPAEADRAALAGLCAGADDRAPAGVLNLLALDEEPLAAHPAVPAGLMATVLLLQALGDAGIDAPLWTLTRGAVSVSPAEPLPHPAQAQAWGLGRVAALEHPQRWGGLIDLPQTTDHRTAARLAAVLTHSSHEDQVAVRA